MPAFPIIGRAAVPPRPLARTSSAPSTRSATARLAPFSGHYRRVSGPADSPAFLDVSVSNNKLIARGFDDVRGTRRSSGHFAGFNTYPLERAPYRINFGRYEGHGAGHMVQSSQLTGSKLVSSRVTQEGVYSPIDLLFGDRPMQTVDRTTVERLPNGNLRVTEDLGYFHRRQRFFGPFDQPLKTPPGRAHHRVTEYAPR